MTNFAKINYKNLNSRQKENYNFQKVAGVLADYGYNCLRLTDDWQGADFIACHIGGEEFLKIQLKGRFTCDKKYMGKSIYIAFITTGNCYVYPHDEMMDFVDRAGRVNNSKSWKEIKAYSWPKTPVWILDELKKYML